MPPRKLELQEATVKKQLQKNTFIATICAVAGFSLLIPAFSVAGSRFDQQEFCFLPKHLTNPLQHDFCTGSKIRRGIAWRVATEASENNEFKSKVTFLDFLPAKNPNAGLYGLCSAGFFFCAFLMFKNGTNDLEDTLDIFVWNKQSLVMEHALKSSQHLEIEQLRSEQEGAFIKDMMNREHDEALCSLMSEEELVFEVGKHKKAAHMDDARFNLEDATIQAQTAEQLEKKSKYEAEVRKLDKISKAKSTTLEPIGDEAVKKELIEKLKEHESGWLHTLCTTRKVLLIEGEQGSFKSYTAAIIAYLRYYLQGHKLGWVVDSDYHQNKSKAWKILQGLEVEAYGANKNGTSIKEGIERFLEGIKVRDEDNFEVETVIFDELTTYGDYEECQEVAKSFMKFALSAPRKANYGLIAITHSMTNEGTGKGGGMAEARKRGTLHLLLNADNDYNPTFQGTLNGLKDGSGQLIEDMAITLPDWFRPDKIFIASEA